MKIRKVFIILNIIIFMGCVCADVPSQHKTRHYDKHGRYKGYSIESEYGGPTRYYDEKGRYQGYSTKRK